MLSTSLSLTRFNVFLFNLQEHFVLFLRYILTLLCACNWWWTSFILVTRQQVPGEPGLHLHHFCLLCWPQKRQSMGGRWSVFIREMHIYLLLLLTASDVLVEYLMFLTSLPLLFNMLLFCLWSKIGNPSVAVRFVFLAQVLRKVLLTEWVAS